VLESAKQYKTKLKNNESMNKQTAALLKIPAFWGYNDASVDE
jgi:hypothetical protein